MVGGDQNVFPKCPRLALQSVCCPDEERRPTFVATRLPRNFFGSLRMLMPEEKLRAVSEELVRLLKSSAGCPDERGNLRSLRHCM